MKPIVKGTSVEVNGTVYHFASVEDARGFAHCVTQRADVELCAQRFRGRPATPDDPDEEPDRSDSYPRM